MARTRGEWSGRRPGRWIAGAAVLALLVGGVLVLVDRADEATGPGPATVDARAPEPVDSATALSLARSQGKPVEVSAENTVTNTTYANPDGTLTRRLSVQPVRARKNGRWVAIDPTFERVGDAWSSRATVSTVTIAPGDRSGQPTTAPTTPHGKPTTSAPARVHAAGDLGRVRPAAFAVAPERAPEQPAAEPGQELVRMTTDEHTLALTWPASLPPADVIGNRALYRNVLPDVDLVITAEADGFSQVLVVRTAAAAANPLLRNLEYGLRSDTLRFSVADSGAVRALGPDGSEVAVAPAPFMWDSAGTATQEDTARAAASAFADLRGLTALDGPLDGGHDAMVGASVADGTLTLRPAADLLDDSGTVYPVLIDPSFKGHTEAWTLVSKQHPSSSFWNGSGYDGGTDEARAGHESYTGQTQRSFFRVNWDLDNVILKSATFRILETHSWSCTKRDIELWHTNGISSSTTWNNQPKTNTMQGKVSAAHGYNSSCPDDYVAFTVMDAAKKANTSGAGSLTFKLEASSETDNKAWKKFKDNPVIDVSFNRKPGNPYSLQSLPLTGCTTKAPYPVLGLTDVTFKAAASDPDSNLKSIHLTVWPQSNVNAKVFNADVAVKKDAKDAKLGRLEKLLDDTTFANATYLWNTQAVDAEGAKSAVSATCGFVVDHSRPNPPKVSSVEFPTGDEGDDELWKTPLGTPGTFTFTGSGTDTVKYLYSVDAPTFTRTATMSGTVGTAKDVLPVHAGPNVLYVKAEDKARNQSNTTAYLFYVTPRDTVDGPGDTTGDQFADLFAVNQDGNLELYASDGTGDVNQPLSAAPKAPDGYWTGALITHNGDYWAGDGMQDLIARMPDKKLWIYPGNGLGGVDVTRRMPLQLPDGAPDPASYTQILSVGDIDGSGEPDMFVLAGNQLWALLGYTGATMSRAVKLPSTEWSGRSIVTVADHNADGAVDLVYRASTGALLLRNGKKAGAGTDLDSLATAAASATGKDTAYSAASWDAANIRLIAGTPDATRDGKADIWVVKNDNTVWLYPGGVGAQGAGRKIAVATDGRDWTGTKTIG